MALKKHGNLNEVDNYSVGQFFSGTYAFKMVDEMRFTE